jgi:hypothetical protein
MQKLMVLPVLESTELVNRRMPERNLDYDVKFTLPVMLVQVHFA